jgi:sulfatase modifying factor 1
MKKLLAAIFVALLMAGCGEDEETTKVVEDDTATSAPEPSREPSPAPVPETPRPKPRTPPKKVSPVPVNLSTSAAEAKPFTIPDLSMEMLWVKPGTFEMGRSSGTSDQIQHSVSLTEGFWLGKYEVTQAQWERVMGGNPSEFKGASRPVEMVSWTEVSAFCEKLTELERKAQRLPADMAYQLPTEAQWEYACRAGTKTAFSFGESLISEQANIAGGPGETAVGKYPANAWGFHDMHGNVWEWVADWYEDYPSGAARDPVGPADGSGRVIRGGSRKYPELFARSANRSGIEPALSLDSLGFRLSLRPASQ